MNFSWLWIMIVPSSGMWRYVTCQMVTNVLEPQSTSIVYPKTGGRK
jgi:hypothetical protein